jgi:YopX protein.
MRHRVYRAKTKADGEWIQGHYLEQQETTYCFRFDYDSHPDNTKYYIMYDWMIDWGLPNEHRIVEVLPETVGQCVDNRDKNNKEIFEGDIVKVDSMFVSAEDNIFVVEWNSAWAAFCFHNPFNMIGFDTIEPDEIEIIGNIHDNPELSKNWEIVEED